MQSNLVKVITTINKIMIKLYDTTGFGYIEVEVEQFYANDYPMFFAKTGKDTYLHDLEQPVYTVPEMLTGNRPADGGALIIEEKDYDDFIKREPAAKKYIKRLIGSREFIHNLKRYCLWLVDCPPNEIRKMPLVYERVKACRENRLKGAPDRQKLAATPHLFRETRNPSNYLFVPQVSSSRREYIPMGFMNGDFIVTNPNFWIPDAKYWHFGVLTSFPHMVWMRMTCGRLRNDYRYSAQVVYNNFVWPPFWREVERTASKILMARRNYPDASFADLYDPVTMPKDLRKAHEENDRAVMAAYDFPKNMSELEMERAFLRMYDSLTNMEKIFYS